MTAGRFAQIEQLFHAAAELPAGERGGYLDAACGNDRELRAEVEALLAAEGPALSDTFSDAAAELVEEPAASYIGEQFGPWRITGLIGRGGMGAVYRAEREGDYTQHAALKVLEVGALSTSLLERFRQERRILARLEHPNIARLIDGGAFLAPGTTAETPYFVMELVEGEPLHSYCATRGIGLRGRIQLFRQVCAAVQYAHEQLVVHRDLKPENILVTAAGVPKLLDFGIARLLDPDRENGEQTALFRAFTPDYASPELVRGEPVSAAGDVYSLGVLLYELLTSRRPYHLRGRSPAGMIEVHSAADPPRPSQVDGPFARQLRGDLDNILLMALERDPGRRYSSVERFSEDLRRYLEGLPVTARAATRLYRTRKFVQRHRLTVAAAALLVLSLAGGATVSTIQARRAERRFNQVRELAHAVLFELYDRISPLPGSTGAREAIVTEVVHYLDSLALDAGGDSGLLAELARAYERVGDVQGFPGESSLGRTEAALASYRKALAIWQQVPDGEAYRDDLARCHSRIAYLLENLGDITTAQQHAREQVRIIQELHREKPGDPELLDHLAGAHLLLGSLAASRGDSTGCLAEYERALGYRQEWGRRHDSTAAQFEVALVQLRLVEALHVLGQFPRALQAARLAVQQFQACVRAEPQNVRYRRRLAAAYLHLSDLHFSTRYPSLEQPRESLAFAMEGVRLCEELVVEDRLNSDALITLGALLERVAWARTGTDPQGAAIDASRAVDLYTTLIEREPGNREAAFRRPIARLVLAHARLAGRMRDRAAAAARDAVGDFRRLPPISPANAGERLAALRIFNDAAAVAAAAEGAAKALPFAEEALAHARVLARLPLPALGFAAQISRAYDNAAAVFASLGRLEDARELRRLDLELWQAWPATLPFIERQQQRARDALAAARK